MGALIDADRTNAFGQALRIAYCGYNYYANCLEYLLRREDIRILKIFACEIGGKQSVSSEIVRLANQYQIPLSFAPIREADIEELFGRMDCDYILSAGYAYKIPIGNHRGLNIHPTQLPIGRGAYPFPKIILDGYKESGVTIHKLTDKFDAGDIVVQCRFSLDEQETEDTLTCKTQTLGPGLLKEWLDNHEELWDKAKPQGEGDYWKRPDKAMQTVTPEMTPDQANRVIRAFGSHGVYIKTTVDVWASACVMCQKEERKEAIGTVLYAQNGFLSMVINGGVLYASRAGKPGQKQSDNSSSISQQGKGILNRIRRRIQKMILLCSRQRVSKYG